MQADCDHGLHWSILKLHILEGICSLDMLYLEGKSHLLMRNDQVEFGDMLPETSKSNAFWDMGVNSHLKWLPLFSPNEAGELDGTGVMLEKPYQSAPPPPLGCWYCCCCCCQVPAAAAAVGRLQAAVRAGSRRGRGGRGYIRGGGRVWSSQNGGPRSSLTTSLPRVSRYHHYHPPLLLLLLLPERYAPLC